MQGDPPDPRSTERSSPSRARERTSRAILDAAITTLSREPGASLGRIAEAAGVGRTTLHRHFADRAKLVRALARDADDQTVHAIERSRLHEGSAVAALGRLLYELLLLGDRFSFLLREPELVADPEVLAAERRTTQVITDLIARGQREGEVRRDLPPAWIAEAAGTLVYAAWIAVESGSLDRAEAHGAVLAVLLDGVRE